MEILEPNIKKYIDNVTKRFDGEAGELQEYAYQRGLPITRPQTAKFISTLLAALRPKDVLEIGCCIGFSAGLMSGFLAKGGHITTIERYDIMIKKARENIEHYGWRDKITLLEGDAKDMLKSLTVDDRKFDFIFMDAAKGQYINFLPDCIKMLNVGGILLADDILKDGYLAMERSQVPRRQRTTHKRMRKFVYALTRTDGLETALLTVGSGLAMCTKLKDDISINTKGFEIEYDE
ncbi:MAG: O-methyltransferase [Defluviitaleaceae bacterium]|nr:O-methyltransferase [Defluviitaleaceae bacterium]